MNKDQFDAVTLKDGLLIRGDCLDPRVQDLIRQTAGALPLIVADPPYGNIVSAHWDRVTSSASDFCEWMLRWTSTFAELSAPGAALYVWGGIGRPGFRPFYRYLVEVEARTPYQLSSHITWAKKRAYGIQWGYLFTREELAYLVLGDIKKPRRFNVPLLETKRGYAGYDPDHPAKSEFYRRTNVWTDITEILRGKKHPTQKPDRTSEIPIEVHTQADEYVLDPFAGSGTTGRAARRLGRRFILVERDPVSFDLCLKSLA